MSSRQPYEPGNMEDIIRGILEQCAVTHGTGQTRLGMFRKTRGFAAELIGRRSAQDGPGGVTMDRSDLADMLVEAFLAGADEETANGRT